MTLLTEVKVPDVGDVADIDVIEVLVQVGDVVEEEQTLAVLETDKASMDLPSSGAGVVKAVHVSVGDKVSEGSLVVTLETGESQSAELVTGKEDIKIDIPEKAESAETQVPETTVNIIEVKVPDVGDVTDIDVIEVLIQTGDTVQKEQTLAVLETDKASMDLPSTETGK